MLPLLPRRASSIRGLSSGYSYHEASQRELGSSALRPLIVRAQKSVSNAGPPLSILCPRLDSNNPTSRRYNESWRQDESSLRRAAPQRRADRDDAHGQPSEALTRACQEVLGLLHTPQPWALVYKLVDVAKIPGFRRALSPTTVAEICRTLDFEKLAEPYKRISEVHRLHRLCGVMKHARAFRKSLKDCVKVITAMMQHWRSTRGVRFKRQEYNSLLAAANEFGDFELAQTIFETMEADGVKPDAASFNHYLEVNCYNYTFDREAQERNEEEATSPKIASKIGLPGVFSPRRKVSVVNNDEGEELVTSGFHGTLVDRVEGNKLIMKISQVMTEQGVAPNTNTYCYVLLSMGRSQNLQGAKEMLVDLWAIDVERILEEDGSSLSLDTPTGRDSAIYPNRMLLFTLAHIFSYHQHPSVVLRIVYHVSQRFGIPISAAIWTELLRGALVFDNLPNVQDPDLGQSDSGHHRPSAVDSLWNMMTSQPHYARPNLTMYRIMMESLHRRGLPLRYYDVFLRARQLVSGKKEQSMGNDLKSSDPALLKTRLEEGRRRALAGTKNTTDMIRSAFLHQRRYITQAMLLLLDKKRWPKRGEHVPMPFYTEEFIPRLLQQSMFFQPRLGMEYEIETGSIRFERTWRISGVNVLMRKAHDEVHGFDIAQNLTRIKSGTAELPTSRVGSMRHLESSLETDAPIAKAGRGGLDPPSIRGINIRELESSDSIPAEPQQAPLPSAVGGLANPEAGY